MSARRKQMRLYTLCIHYSLEKGTTNHDGDYWSPGEIPQLNVDRIVRRLLPDLKYLRQITKSVTIDGQKWEGFAFLFLDPGWSELVAQKITGTRAASITASLINGTADVEERLRLGLDGRRPHERIVTAGRLVHLLNLLPESLPQYLAGLGGILRYDAPKIIEGAIRIANIGRQVPVFRFDDDVIFYGRRSPLVSTDIARRRAVAKARSSIVLLCRHYAKLSRDPAVHYFAFSGSYVQPAGWSQRGRASTGRSKEFDSVNGFATRVVQLAKLPSEGAVDDSSEASLDVPATLQFLRDLHKIGANPFRQVISGAGLCLSDSAILDLPPFSNMQSNVMWIDDHLKYALHDELGHLGRRSRTHHAARIANAEFSQLRRAPDHESSSLFTYENVKWNLEFYMMRVVLGAIADSWLREDPRLKLQTKPLSKVEYDKLRILVPGLFARKFMDVVPKGWAGQSKRERATQERVFKQQLWDRALTRLRDLVEIWGGRDYAGTFLGLFVAGSSHERYDDFREFMPKGMPLGLAAELGKLPERLPARRRSPADSARLALRDALAMLVDDFIDYYELVLSWPLFVQAVRLQLNFHEAANRHDLEWMFPFTPRDPG